MNELSGLQVKPGESRTVSYEEVTVTFKFTEEDLADRRPIQFTKKQLRDLCVKDDNQEG